MLDIIVREWYIVELSEAAHVEQRYHNQICMFVGIAGIAQYLQKQYLTYTTNTFEIDSFSAGFFSCVVCGCVECTYWESGTLC